MLKSAEPPSKQEHKRGPESRKFYSNIYCNQWEDHHEIPSLSTDSQGN